MWRVCRNKRAPATYPSQTAVIKGKMPCSLALRVSVHALVGKPLVGNGLVAQLQLQQMVAVAPGEIDVLVVGLVLAGTHFAATRHAHVVVGIKPVLKSAAASYVREYAGPGVAQAPDSHHGGHIYVAPVAVAVVETHLPAPARAGPPRLGARDRLAGPPPMEPPMLSPPALTDETPPYMVTDSYCCGVDV